MNLKNTASILPTSNSIAQRIDKGYGPGKNIQIGFAYRILELLFNKHNAEEILKEPKNLNNIMSQHKREMEGLFFRPLLSPKDKYIPSQLYNLLSQNIDNEQLHKYFLHKLGIFDLSWETSFRRYDPTESNLVTDEEGAKSLISLTKYAQDKTDLKAYSQQNKQTINSILGLANNREFQKFMTESSNRIFESPDFLRILMEQPGTTYRIHTEPQYISKLQKGGIDTFYKKLMSTNNIDLPNFLKNWMGG